MDDKYKKIGPLVGLAGSSVLMFLVHIVRDNGKYGAAEDRDKRAVAEIPTLRDLERKLREMRKRRNVG